MPDLPVGQLIFDVESVRIIEALKPSNYMHQTDFKVIVGEASKPATCGLFSGLERRANLFGNNCFWS